MPNAFDLLMTASSSPHSKSTARQTLSPKRPSRRQGEPRASPDRVACPACGKVIPVGFVNAHLDLECGREKDKESGKRKGDSDAGPEKEEKGGEKKKMAKIEEEKGGEMKKMAKIVEGKGGEKKKMAKVEEEWREEIDDEDDVLEEAGSTSNETTLVNTDKDSTFLRPLTHHPVPLLPSLSSPPHPKSHRQSSLHTFLNLPVPTPLHFVLVWPAEPLQPPSVQFTASPPPHAAGFRASFRWKDLGADVILCSNLPGDAASAWEDQESVYRNGTLLKSHLQKCVRTGMDDLAVRTAWELMRCKGREKRPVDGVEELLRRMPIVIMEDVSLHASFPILIWLMAAHAKGFRLPRVCVAWVLGLVRAVATSPKRDIPAFEEQPNAMKIGPKEIKEAQYPGGDDARALLYALGVRRAWGGLKGDLTMLANALTTWHYRLLAHPTHPPPLLITSPVPPVDPFSLPLLQPKEWDLTAVDAHCSDVLETVMERCVGVRARGWKKEEVKAMMWRFGGGRNVRDTREEDDDEDGEREEWDKVWRKEIRQIAWETLVNRM